MLHDSNQYPPMVGVPELRQALAEHSERYTGLPLDWQSQVLITSGATEALAAAFLGLLEPGDEVVVFAPLYDSYIPIIRRAGAVPVVVQLRAPDWSFDAAGADWRCQGMGGVTVHAAPLQQHHGLFQDCCGSGGLVQGSPLLPSPPTHPLQSLPQRSTPRPS